MPEPKPRIYKCPKCEWLCIKNIETLRDGTAVHTLCGAKVIDVTEEVDQNNRVPFGSYD